MGQVMRNQLPQVDVIVGPQGSDDSPQIQEKSAVGVPARFSLNFREQWLHLLHQRKGGDFGRDKMRRSNDVESKFHWISPPCATLSRLRFSPP